MAAEYYYARDGQRFGPFSGNRLKKLAATGQLRSTDLVWIPEKNEWVFAAKITTLFPPATPRPEPTADTPRSVGSPPPLPPSASTPPESATASASVPARNDTAVPARRRGLVFVLGAGSVAAIVLLCWLVVARIRPTDVIAVGDETAVEGNSHPLSANDQPSDKRKGFGAVPQGDGNQTSPRKTKVPPRDGERPPVAPKEPKQPLEPQGQSSPSLESLIKDAKALKPVAIQQLAAIGPKAIPAIVQELRRDDRRFSWASVVMAKMGPDAVEPVAKLMFDSDHLIRKVAYTTLGEMGPIAIPALPALELAAVREYDPRNRGLPESAYRQIMRRP
jgi:hypothetical protein